MMVNAANQHPPKVICKVIPLDAIFFSGSNWVKVDLFYYKFLLVEMYCGFF